MYNGTIQIDPAAVQQNGQRFKELSTDYKSCMSNLQSTVDDLGTCWKSEDHDTFVSIYERNKETIDQMGRAFEEFGTLLDKAGSNFAKMTSEIQSSFRSGN